jgi:hypothetical protein
VPELLAPWSGGAARSGLIEMLQQGHKGVKLSREEVLQIACWIDLLVPYCGDYREANAWTGDEIEKYERYAAKRRRMENLERENVQKLPAVSASAPQVSGNETQMNSGAIR